MTAAKDFNVDATYCPDIIDWKKKNHTRSAEANTVVPIYKWKWLYES